MVKRLQGKVAVITGGNSGIGFATAKAYVNEGANVVITGRNQEQLDKAGKDLGVTAIKSDSAVISDIENLYAKVKEKFGRIDVLFLNAGIAPFVPMEIVDEKHFDSVFDVNVKGVFYGVQKAIPILNKGASVIITSSGVNKQGMPGTVIYGASKAAVRSFARSMSAELVDRGIRVNVISPGPIATPIFGKVGFDAKQMEEMGKQITQMVPMKRLGKPEEIAGPAVFLASDDSSYMLGEEICVDGGLTEL